MAILRVIRFHVDNMRLPAGELALLPSTGPPSLVLAIDVPSSTAASCCKRLRAAGQGIWLVGSSVSATGGIIVEAKKRSGLLASTHLVCLFTYVQLRFRHCIGTLRWLVHRTLTSGSVHNLCKLSTICHLHGSGKLQKETQQFINTPNK